MKARALAATMVAVVTMLLAGCGSSSDDDGGAATGARSGQEKVRVYVLLPSLESDSYVRERNGAEEAAKQLEGAEVTVNAGASAARRPT